MIIRSFADYIFLKMSSIVELLVEDLPIVLVELITALLDEQLILVEFGLGSLTLHYFNAETVSWDGSSEILVPQFRFRADKIFDHTVFAVTTNRITRYDLNTNTVITYPDLPWEKESYPKPFLVGEIMYAIGPLDQATLHQGHSFGNVVFKLVYNIWIRVPNTPHPYSSATMTTTDRYIYITSTLSHQTRVISMYDTITEQWSTIEPLEGHTISYLFTVNNNPCFVMEHNHKVVMYVIKDSFWHLIATFPDRVFAQYIKSAINIGSKIACLNINNNMLIWDMDTQRWSEIIPHPPMLTHFAGLAKS